METWQGFQAEASVGWPSRSFHRAISQLEMCTKAESKYLPLKEFATKTKTQTHLPSLGKSTEYPRAGHSLLVQAPASLSSSPAWFFEGSHIETYKILTQRRGVSKGSPDIRHQLYQICVLFSNKYFVLSTLLSWRESPTQANIHTHILKINIYIMPKLNHKGKIK